MEAVVTTIGASMISAILQPMAERAGKEMLDQCDKMVNIKREIHNLQNSLHLIQAVIQDAEEKQIENIHIRAWLRRLVDIGYEARDVLDEFFTFSASIRSRRTSRPVKLNTLPFCFSLSCFNVGSSSSTIPVALPFRLRSRLASDIRCVRKSLDDLMRQKEIVSILNPVGGPGGLESVPMRHRPQTGPFEDKQKDRPVGRDEVREKIMKKIVNSKDKEVHLVPIWGTGGVGKTFLAQSIYNDKTILKEEDYPMKNRKWLCVGEKEFNANEIIMKIIDERDTSDVEAIQRKLVAKFKGGRFLIVLDDVWKLDSTEWNLLWNPLTNVGKGGVIMITTRISKTISATNTPVSVSDNLKPLSDEECWLIFESHAFVDGCADDKLELKLIGRQIVKELKGLPLAAKVVGRSLLNEPDVKTWENFLEAEEWKQGRDTDDIIPALRWSYNHLPSHLKQCFSYCALFPKDHVFDEKVLVEMWMAHDLIQNVGGGGEKRRPEDVGAQYFKNLVYNSLFDCVDGKYMMHDIIHDLALLVSNEEFAIADASLFSIAKIEKARHIYILDYLKKNLSLFKSNRILTVWAPNWLESRNTVEKYFLLELFKQLKSVRVLILSHKDITEIPDCISKLKHLRYLDVRYTRIKCMPDSLCDIQNLQMLATPIDAILPKNIVNMVNLRYLRGSLSSCEGVGHLRSLQELSSINVREHDNISELGALQQLHGKLTVKGLENVSSSEDAAQALMQDKLSLDELELEFSKKSSIATDVLDALRCPKNLKYLKIVGYTGLRPPIWMVDGNVVANLRTLNLSECHQLKFLPPLGELKYLKHLFLWSLDGVERLGDEFYGKGINGTVFFPSLEYLTFHGMKKWEEWGAIMDSSATFFPCLKCLRIFYCPSLVSAIPPTETCISSMKGRPPITNDGNVMRSLEILEIHNCGKLTKIELGSLPTLGRLGVYGCEKLKSVSTNFQALDSIEELFIRRNCPLLELKCDSSSSSSTLLSSSPWSRLQTLDIDNEYIFRNIFEQDLGSIKELEIYGEIIFECLGEIMENSCDKLKSLKSLAISSCSQLQSLPTGCLPHSLQRLSIQLCPQLQSLPTGGLPHSLENLLIQNCPQLQSLPAGGLPPSLRELWISGCPLLYERCKDESGLDWHKIKHIHEIHIHR